MKDGPVEEGRAERSRAAEVAVAFLKLGFTAFGGPAAHIAMMRQEFVERRKWVSDEEFARLIGLTNLIPGPNSTEMAIHLGMVRAGFPGLVLAGLGFILPAMGIVMALAWVYVHYQTLPQMGPVMAGMKPVVVAIVFHALAKLVRPVVKLPLDWLIALAAFGLAWAGVPEVAIVFVPGVALGLIAAKGDRKLGRPLLFGLAGVAALAAVSALAARFAAPSGAFTLSGLFAIFLKVGAVLYGSGYVLLSYLNSDLVVKLGWLTRGQLLDAVAVGQFTPGPVFTTATFIGYVLGGPAGALAATLAIFLPSFLLVAGSGKWLASIGASAPAQAFMSGVGSASMGLMAMVLANLAREGVTDARSATLAAVAAIFLFSTRVNSAWLVLAGALSGLF